MSCTNPACNQGRNCTCRTGTSSRLSGGGFWFAPGTIDAGDQPEPWSNLELALLAAVLSFAIGIVAGVLYILMQGWAL